jgi:S-adenosylmethionine decarboxylase
MPRPQKIQLHGFNNLTKTLSFNLYDISYAASPRQEQAYIRYIDAEYSAERLTEILCRVSEIIGAEVLNVARQDYEPHGASVTMLISEEPIAAEQIPNTEAPGPLPQSVVGHLNKSHLTVHTYPESHSFESDVVIMDYRVRGFTRDVRGRKHYIDHKINSIQNYLARDTRKRYQTVDVNVHQENIFHTKMMRKEFEFGSHLFGVDAEQLPQRERRMISDKIRREVLEIFYGRNISRGM